MTAEQTVPHQAAPEAAPQPAPQAAPEFTHIALPIALANQVAQFLGRHGLETWQLIGAWNATAMGVTLNPPAPAADAS